MQWGCCVLCVKTDGKNLPQTYETFHLPHRGQSDASTSKYEVQPESCRHRDPDGREKQTLSEGLKTKMN